jgi:hypothetical protein
VLEAEIEDVRLAARRDVARHLQRHRRLAGALRATDQQQLTWAKARAHRLVHGREAKRNRLVVAHLARRDLVVEIDQHVEGRTRGHAAVGGIEPPCAVRCSNDLGGLGAHGHASSR